MARLLSTLAALGLASGAEHNACSLAGPWHYHGEQYLIAADGDKLTAKVVPGHQAGCSWCEAHGTLGVDGRAEMHYDNGDSNTGTVAADSKLKNTYLDVPGYSE